MLKSSRALLLLVFSFSQLYAQPAPKEYEYGKELFTNTARYIGPRGSGEKISGNRMTCQNCHLQGATKPFGISLQDSHALYPMYRAREGKIVTLAERINSCMQRPMQGIPLRLDSKEMSAMLLYLKSIAEGRVVTSKDPYSRLVSIRFLARPASPERGGALFVKHCESCHGKNGEGKLTQDEVQFEYPPLWGNESYKEGSSMARVVVLARFIKANMPLGATAEKPVLTDEESFDLAAFVNSKPRPALGKALTFPNINEKPIDYPVGPYADPFDESQHKFGPWAQIQDFYTRKGVAEDPGSQP